MATAIANAGAQAEVTASRARIVAAADQARRQIERDLHDGAQQRLVYAGAAGCARRGPRCRPSSAGWARNSTAPPPEATGALDELTRDRPRHPPGDPGQGRAPPRPSRRSPAARRSPSSCRYAPTSGCPSQVEVSAYYVVAEALTNAARHSRASAVSVEVEVAGEVLRVAVRDDGAGGADLARGTGLVGLKDRVQALGGRIFLDSRSGAGTSLQAEFPLTTTNDGVTSG